MIVQFWQSSFYRLYQTVIKNFSIPNTVAGPQRPELTDHLRKFQESMTGDDISNVIFAWLLVAAIAIFGLWLLFRWLKIRKAPVISIVNDPNKLFNDLLDRLHLDPSDKLLLREMTEQTRLRHPTICLLSPGLLKWTGKLWQTEKGEKNVGAEKLARLDNISTIIYDHCPPAAAGPKLNQNPKATAPSATSA